MTASRPPDKAQRDAADQPRPGEDAAQGSNDAQTPNDAQVPDDAQNLDQAAAPARPVARAGVPRLYGIGELSDAFKVTTRAIRFYEAKGLIAPERRGTTRLYTRRDRARLQMILRGKNLGFTLEEIREFLDLYDADPSMTVQTRHLLGKVEAAITDLACKRADIDRSLQELAQIRRECLQHLQGTDCADSDAEDV